MSLARYLSKLGALLNSDGKVPQAALAANVAGNGPAFSAYPSSNQTISSAVATKVTLDAELFDTNNNFASSRFTPTVAGYYQISLGFQPEPSTSMTRVILTLYKNGSMYSAPQDFDGLRGVNATGTLVNKISGSLLVYMNGSTDYLEMYVYIFAATPVIGNGVANTFMTGFLARSA